jgi:4'-phosphopantetheinyl transferase
MQYLSFSLGGNETELITARIDISNEKLASFAKTLSLSELERSNEFKFDRDKKKYIFVRGLLRELISIRLAIPSNQIEFSYGNYGKPYLHPGPTNSKLYFNLSHSHDYVSFAFSKNAEVGIDIEAMARRNDADAVACHTFSPKELEMYSALSPALKLQGFFNCWTRKEAFVKALGAGLDYALDSFDVSLIPNEPAKIFQIRNPVDADRIWHILSFLPAPGYAGCLIATS